jgi:ketosteroid isomerase-like protein
MVITLLVFAFSCPASAQEQQKATDPQSKPSDVKVQKTDKQSATQEKKSTPDTKTDHGQAGQHSQVEQDLMQIERDWAAAMVKKDTAALGRFTADDWVFTAPDGRLQTRAEIEAELGSGDLKFESSTVDDLKVRVFGDTAIVTGRTTDKGQYKGQDISGQYRFTDIFVKRNGRWQSVSTHVSRIAQ